MGALRLGAAALLNANLIAAYLVVRPIGGSPEELREQLSTLRVQVQVKRAVDEHIKTMAGKVQTGRQQGTQFLNAYFLDDALNLKNSLRYQTPETNKQKS